MKSLLPGLLALSVCLTSCKRIEAKLDRLARLAGITAAQPDKPKVTHPAEEKLTPEQEALESRLKGSAVFEPAAPSAPEPAEKPFELNKSSVVSILGYHDFRERGGSPMIIAAAKFREQMQAIKDSGIPVIPLSDVLAWRKGQKLAVHGWIYGIKDGLLHDLDLCISGPDQIPDVYRAWPDMRPPHRRR